jgi:hypothetical protein
MKIYPNIFMPILGVVLFYLISDWLNIAITFRCILHRIVRNNEENTPSDSSRSDTPQNSNLLTIEMQDYNPSRL